MPNPVMLPTTTSTAAAKPASTRNEAGQNGEVTSFEDILGQETGGDEPPEPELLVTAPEMQDSGTETESADQTEPQAAPIAEPQLVATLAGNSTKRANRMFIPEGDQPPSTHLQAGVPRIFDSELPEQPQISTSSGQPNRADPVAPTAGRPDAGLVHTAVAQQPIPVKVAENGRPIEQMTKATGKLSVPDIGPNFQNTDPVQPTEVTPATSKPAIPDRAPPVAQLQLMATLAEKEQNALVQEAEPTVFAKDEPLQLAPRETTPQLSAPSASARAELARAIAGQLAATIQTRPGTGITEIALNPEELGRVSIVLNGRDDGLHMTIALERPETLELMRRHISVLSEEFQKLGYGALSFDLGTASDADTGGANTKETESGSVFEPKKGDSDVQTDSLPQILVPSRGIDMRF